MIRCISRAPMLYLNCMTSDVGESLYIDVLYKYRWTILYTFKDSLEQKKVFKIAEELSERINIEW